MKKPSYAQLKAQVAALEKATAPKDLTFRVGEKGGVSVYGMGRFPVTLYREQWERLLAEKERLLAFIEQHRSQLKTKAA